MRSVLKAAVQLQSSRIKSRINFGWGKRWRLLGCTLRSFTIRLQKVSEISLIISMMMKQTVPLKPVLTVVLWAEWWIEAAVPVLVFVYKWVLREINREAEKKEKLSQ